MKKVMVALITMSGLLLWGAGCGKDEPKSDTGSAAGAIGVAECDEYIKKFDACLAKMPAAAKPAQEQASKQLRDGWKAAAATPQGKEGLKTGCKAALDSLAQNPMCK
jgi:hypothetical protein